METEDINRKLEEKNEEVLSLRELKEQLI